MLTEEEFIEFLSFKSTIEDLRELLTEGKKYKSVETKLLRDKVQVRKFLDDPQLFI